MHYFFAKRFCIYHINYFPENLIRIIFLKNPDEKISAVSRKVKSGNINKNNVDQYIALFYAISKHDITPFLLLINTILRIFF